MKKRDLRQQAAWISFAVSLLVLLLKGMAALSTGSTALLSDALETLVNVVTAVVALMVVRFASQPADPEHPYGHGKAEFVSSAFEGGLIVFAAFAIILESARALWEGPNLQELEIGASWALIAAGLNLALGLFLRQVSRRENSEALAASSVHVLSDVKTTAGVLVGLVFVRLTGWVWLDPVLAMAVGGHLIWEGWTVVRRSLGGLIDETDQKSLEALAKIIEANRNPGVIDLHLMRVIRAGSFMHVDAHLVVPEFWDVLKAHACADEFEKKVVKAAPFEGEFAFHLDPCRRQFCRGCSVSECPVREREFEKLRIFDVPHLIGLAQKD